MFDQSDDLAATYDTDDFATCVTFTLASGATLKVHGSFDEGSDAVTLADTRIEAVEPNITCQTCKITDPLLREEDTASLKVDGVTRTFTVKRIQKIGTGDSVVYLKS
jgi:polyisoprenoid-binding protein YceI